MSSAALADWTSGAHALVYQRCEACKSTWYFRRTFCPHCGGSAVTDVEASGRGVVHAVTLVTRAPTEEMRAYAPYLIVLIDVDEGFRLMAHGEASLEIGDRVRIGFKTLAGRLIPYFEKEHA